MKKRILYILAVFIISISASTDNSTLIANKDIIWAADVQFSIYSGPTDDIEYDYINIKNPNVINEKGKMSDMLSCMFDNVLSGHYLLYPSYYVWNDDHDIKPITKEIAKRQLSDTSIFIENGNPYPDWDTIVTIKDIKKENMQGLTLSQEWIYDIKKNTLSVINNYYSLDYTSIDKVKNTAIGGGWCTIVQTPYKTIKYDSKDDLGNPNIVWAKRLSWFRIRLNEDGCFNFEDVNRQSKIELYQDDIKSFWNASLSQLFYDLYLEGKIQAYEDSDFKKPIPKDSAKSKITWQWAFMYKSNVTGKEWTEYKPMISPRDDANGIIIKTKWFYNKKTKKLECKPYAACVLGTVFGNYTQGLELNQKLFWIKLN